jgi:hypothetical protein
MQVYHAGDEVSKGILICRNEISIQDHEHGSLAAARCRKQVRRPGTRIIVVPTSEMKKAEAEYSAFLIITTQK